MALTNDDITLLKSVMVETIIEVVGPMFEQQTLELTSRMDKLESRMDKLESRMDKLEREFQDFKTYITSRLNTLEAKVDYLEELYTKRFGYVEEDVVTLYHLVDKLEKGTREEKVFAEKAIVKHLPAIYRVITVMAKKYDIDLSNA